MVTESWLKKYPNTAAAFSRDGEGPDDRGQRPGRRAAGDGGLRQGAEAAASMRPTPGSSRPT